jgi:hypothetical protein
VFGEYLGRGNDACMEIRNLRLITLEGGYPFLSKAT